MCSLWKSKFTRSLQPATHICLRLAAWDTLTAISITSPNTRPICYCITIIIVISSNYDKIIFLVWKWRCHMSHWLQSELLGQFFCQCPWLRHWLRTGVSPQGSHGGYPLQPGWTQKTYFSTLSWVPLYVAKESSCSSSFSSPSSPSNLSINYFGITQEIGLELLNAYCHKLFRQCVFVVSGLDSEVNCVLCGSHETGWSRCACSIAPIRPLLCMTYSTGLDHLYAPHAKAGLLHWQQAAQLSECRLSDLITQCGRRGHGY